MERLVQWLRGVYALGGYRLFEGSDMIDLTSSPNALRYWDNMTIDERAAYMQTHADQGDAIRTNLLNCLLAQQQLTQEKQRIYRTTQWRIDVERAKHTNPLGACVAVYEIMVREVYGESGTLMELSRRLTELHASVLKMAQSQAELRKLLVRPVEPEGGAPSLKNHISPVSPVRTT